MKTKKYASIFFAIFATGVFFFQLALALGAPWGKYTMGGAYPGQFPTELRVAAFIQALIWVFFAATVISRAGVALASWARTSRKLVWIVVVITGISTVLNLLTPSTEERMIWAPVATLMFVCSLIVAKPSQTEQPAALTGR